MERQELTPPSMAISIGTLRLQNPILTASGTFGYGEEAAPFGDLSRLGGIISKTVTRRPRTGNAPPRVCETPGGMLNAIGLQNIGVDRFVSQRLPYLQQLGTKIIANVAGETVEDFAELASTLAALPVIDAIELNISCPNVAHGLDFATDPRLTEEVLRAARSAVEGSSVTLIAKLSPNVTDVASVARAAENGGAHAVSLVNTFLGMAIDARKRKPRLSNITGGLSGPAIKPLALRAVYQCARVIKIPIIGIGGIGSGEDAAEFLIAGATAVQVGTATFVQPDAPLRVLSELQTFLCEQGIADVNELIGSLQT
jgi:dihydroorotate dehydrogenase (NAD+) catalytic subunit